MVKRRMTEVRIDQKHSRPSLRDDDPQVDSRGRFPLVWCRAHYDDCLDRAIDTAEADVRPERPIRFGEPRIERLVGEQQTVLSGHQAPPFIARRLCGFARGMMPITGAPSISSATSGSRTELSRYSRTKDRKSTRLNSSHTVISYAVFCLKKKKKKQCQ